MRESGHSFRTIRKILNGAGIVPAEVTKKSKLYDADAAFAAIEEWQDPGAEQSELDQERTRLAKEQADKLAISNAERRGELAPVALLEQILATAGARVCAVFDAIPGKIKRRVPSLRAKDVEAIKQEIASARNVIALMTLSDVGVTAADADGDGME